MSNASTAASRSQQGTVLASTNVTINVMTVFDTDYIKEHYGRSTDPNAPIGIDHNSEFMVAPRDFVISGQGTADLSFKASPGDTVSLWGTTLSDNSDDAIIIYGVGPNGNTGDVFNTFLYNQTSRTGAAVPNPQSLNGIPAIPQPLNFYSYDGKVKGQGQESFIIQFALYSLGDDRETQQLWGYYWWDPTITVG